MFKYWACEYCLLLTYCLPTHFFLNEGSFDVTQDWHKKEAKIKESRAHISVGTTGHLSWLCAERGLSNLQSYAMFYHLHFITSCLISPSLPQHVLTQAYTVDAIRMLYTQHLHFRYIIFFCLCVNSSLESSIMHLHPKQCWHVLWAVSSYCIWVISLGCCVWQVLLQWNVSSPHYTRPRQACLSKFSQRLKIESGSPCLHCQSLLSINPCLAHATDVTITTKDGMTGLLSGVWWSHTTNRRRLFICIFMYYWNIFVGFLIDYDIFQPWSYSSSLSMNIDSLYWSPVLKSYLFWRLLFHSHGCCLSEGIW